MKQTRLFPAPQPLVERLGAAFFRSIPPRPGVYQMFDENGVLIYVGKAGDLRARLGSYRRTTDQSSKTRRLIHEARRIEWQECASETEARLLENRLIRTLRPRFNRAGTWPASARFLHLRRETEHASASAGLEIRILATPEGECYGAFRGGVSRVLAALARLTWFASAGHTDLHALPGPLLREAGVREWRWAESAAEVWLADLRRYLAGEDDQLLARLAEQVPQPGAGFECAFLAADFERLAEFYRSGPRRNRALRIYRPPGTVTLAAEERDDLWVRWSAEHPPEIPGLRLP